MGWLPHIDWSTWSKKQDTEYDSYDQMGSCEGKGSSILRWLHISLIACWKSFVLARKKIRTRRRKNSLRQLLPFEFSKKNILNEWLINKLNVIDIYIVNFVFHLIIFLMSRNDVIKRLVTFNNRQIEHQICWEIWNRWWLTSEVISLGFIKGKWVLSNMFFHFDSRLRDGHEMISNHTHTHTSSFFFASLIFLLK